MHSTISPCTSEHCAAVLAAIARCRQLADQLARTTAADLRKRGAAR